MSQPNIDPFALFLALLAGSCDSSDTAMAPYRLGASESWVTNAPWVDISIARDYLMHESVPEECARRQAAIATIDYEDAVQRGEQAWNGSMGTRISLICDECLLHFLDLPGVTSASWTVESIDNCILGFLPHCELNVAIPLLDRCKDRQLASAWLGEYDSLDRAKWMVAREAVLWSESIGLTEREQAVFLDEISHGIQLFQQDFMAPAQSGRSKDFQDFIDSHPMIPQLERIVSYVGDRVGSRGMITIVY